MSAIRCYGSSRNESITFSRIIDTGQGLGLPLTVQSHYEDYEYLIMTDVSGDGLNRFGAYQCKITDNETETTIATLKLPSYHWVELEAMNPYTSVNVGDSVRLQVEKIMVFNAPIRWRHDGRDVPQWDGRLDVQIQDAKTSDAGVYECFWGGRRDEAAHALMRVIVRSCPRDLFGDACDQVCPPCYNGGVCHDEWGKCVCPPGFAGENCEIACGGNDSLAGCKNSCFNRRPNDSCSGIVFCRPDPYGCSCSPGLKGNDCSEECEPGWYGADCKQPCHCADGNCNPVTGVCEKGCEKGWKGQSCQIQDKPTDTESMAKNEKMEGKQASRDSSAPTVFVSGISVVSLCIVFLAGFYLGV